MHMRVLDMLHYALLYWLRYPMNLRVEKKIQTEFSICLITAKRILERLGIQTSSSFVNFIIIAISFQNPIEDINPVEFLKQVANQSRNQNALFAENFLKMSNVESTCIRQEFCKIASVSQIKDLVSLEQQYTAKQTVR